MKAGLGNRARQSGSGHGTKRNGDGARAEPIPIPASFIPLPAALAREVEAEPVRARRAAREPPAADAVANAALGIARSGPAPRAVGDRDAGDAAARRERDVRRDA